MKRFSTKALLVAVAGAAAIILGATSALAAVTFDAETGEGFVGKGDVQLVYGWNNKALQDNAASVEFRASSEVVTEVSWTCTNSNNSNEQIRERTTTTTIAGVVDSLARDKKNQITGFNLEGYAGAPAESSTTSGNQLNSCPSGPWTLTSPAGASEVVSETSSLQVSADGTTWSGIG